LASLLSWRTMKPKAIFCWSGGKDSAYCLFKILEENKFEVCYLLTTLNSQFKRVSMHGTPEQLLDEQASSIGIPLLKTWVTESTNSEYEKQMETILLKAKSEGIEYVIFGDIFLEDLRTYRENNLAKMGLKAVFPLWKMNTQRIIFDFTDKKFRTVLCCVNDGFLGEEWLGREINSSFLSQLPYDVDPCGENGEYHTFCFDGPLFKHKIEFITGEKVYKSLDVKMTDTDNAAANRTSGFWFLDLLPVNC
jgi:uncharacterized protein (TIGR00290 family)